MGASCTHNCSTLYREVQAAQDERINEMGKSVATIETRIASMSTSLFGLDRQVQVLDSRLREDLKEIKDSGERTHQMLDALVARVSPLEVAKTTTVKMLLAIIAGLATALGVVEGSNVARFFTSLF